MDNKQLYLVPDYFFDFHCKMGACRNACCEGWPIGVSMKDYFMLLGAEVSKELRIRLDCALHLTEHPTEDAYARIMPRYDGSCPMRMEDGRCGLHYELGEHALSDVCRLYPRGVRTGETHECSLANSCEAVVEALMNREEKITFSRKEMDFGVKEAHKRVHQFENAGCETEIRMRLISIMQDRDYTIPERLVLLANRMHLLDQAMKSRDFTRVHELIREDSKQDAPEMHPPTHEGLMSGLDIAGKMLEVLDERSESIRSYGKNALSFFGSGEHEYEMYIKATEQFECALPDWQTWFEHLIVNHMFFSQFPFQDRPLDFEDEFLALVCVYMLLRFLLLGNMGDDFTPVKAADVASAVFRLVEHTEFESFSGKILKHIGNESVETAMRVLNL